MRAPLIALLVILATSVGCVVEDGAPGDPVADRGRRSLPDTLYFTASMGLTPEVPAREEPEHVRLGDFYGRYLRGEEQPTWISTVLTQGALITAATVTFYYTGDPAVVSTGPRDQGFPEFGVYLGPRGATMARGTVQAPDAVAPGEVVEVAVPLTLPLGGLVLPTGPTELAVKLAPVQAQSEGAPMVLLVNATAASSRLDVEATNLALPAAAEVQALHETGMLAGSATAVGEVEGVSVAVFPVEVGPDAVGIKARLSRTTGAGIPDMDLQIVGPNGETVAGSLTPEPTEGLALYGPNLAAGGGAGTWQLRVVNFGNAAAEFTLQAWTLERARIRG